MIPDDKLPAVTRGLQEAFGVSTFEDITPLTGGHTTSLVYRITVAGAPYLLKMILRTEDPTRHFICMRAAAAAGIAPSVHYANIEDRVFITDLVDARPFPLEEAVTRLPRVLRSLHALPPSRLPCHFNTTCTFMLTPGPMSEGFLRKFQESNALTKVDADEVLAAFAEIAAVYPRDDSEKVLCHNDLFKPDNILFDGDRVWLIDWEATFDNDPYADLAAMANLCVFDDADERVYLTEYFGQPPDVYQLARFFLARQLVHIFYSVAFLPMGATGDPADASRPVDFRDLQRRLWTHEFDFIDNETRAEYGRAHWQQFVRNLHGPRWHDELRTFARRSEL